MTSYNSANKLHNTPVVDKHRILYIGNFAPHSVGEPEIARALTSLGHDVTKVGVDFLNEGLLQNSLASFDFVLMSKIQHTALTEGIMSNSAIKTVCWQFDLYWDYRPSVLIKTQPHFQADLVFSTDGGHQKEFEDAGIKHHVLRQGIEEGVKRGKAGEPIDIGFIGTAGAHNKWPYRSKLLSWLEQTYGNRFKHSGLNGRLRHKELNDNIASTKIIICDSVHSPHYWSNRVYEMIGRGAFCIHPKVEGLEGEFEYYKHLVPYNYGDFGGLREKIDYYLTHDEEREVIRKAGHEHCHKYHTYTHRVKELITTVEKCLLKKNQ